MPGINISDKQRRRVMFRQKTAKSRKEHDDIDYQGVDDEGSANRDSDTTLFSWSGFIRRIYRHRGVLWAVMAVCVSTTFSLCIKLLAGKVAASQGMLIRGFSQTLFSLPHLTFYKVSLCFPLKVFIVIFSRGLIGSLCTFLNYFAIQSLPVGTAKALAYSSPLFTGIFARICLGERCSVRLAFFACLTVIAVTFVVQPPFIFGGGDVGNFNAIGLLCAIMGAVVLAANTIILRFTQILRVDVHAIIFVYGIVATFSGGVVTKALGEWTNPACGLDRAFVIGMVIAGFLEQISVTLALKTEPALVVSIIRTNEVFLSFALDVLFFDIVPNIWTIVGAIVVVASSVGMTLSANQENKRRLEEEEEVGSEDGDDDHEVTSLRSEEKTSC